MARKETKVDAAGSFGKYLTTRRGGGSRGDGGRGGGVPVWRGLHAVPRSQEEITAGGVDGGVDGLEETDVDALVHGNELAEIALYGTRTMVRGMGLVLAYGG